MKKILFLLSAIVLILGFAASANALIYSATAGDVDFGANRDAYDVATNMDFYVFPDWSTETGAATNNFGYVAWDYTLPFEITTANSGSMTVHAWDIDSTSAEHIDVYFNFGSTSGSTRIFAGELSGTNGGDITTWEYAVAHGTTAALSGWSSTTYSFSPELLAALTGSTGFTLELDVQNTSTETWAAVIDYASISLNYEPGEQNPDYPVPEPTTLPFLLLGVGLIGFAALRKRGFLHN